jgi:hypothetical protein
LKEGIGFLPSVVFQNNSPSLILAKSGVEKSPQVMSILAAFVPSPLPVAPWQDLQFF